MGYGHVLVAPKIAVHIRSAVEEDFVLGRSRVDEIVSEFVVIEHLAADVFFL